MNDETRALYENKSKQLRASLKSWENDWARAHEGTKPGRQDIKDNPDIARKYKEYNKIRDALAGKVLPPPPPPPKDDGPRPEKRKPDAIPSGTPLKRTKHAETPSRARLRDDELMNTPAISRKLFSPAPVTSLGPTPQRDGRVLGLFDLLVEKELGTPPQTGVKGAGGKSETRPSIHATPSKRSSVTDGDSGSKPGRTPMSTSKRQLLNAFTTPLKNRNGNPAKRTPTSVSKLLFDTPAFLKRHSLPTLDEDDATFVAPAPLRLPRKPLVRGLSEIVASLRKVEEEKLDEDLEALRDAENEQAGMDKPPRLPPQAPANVLEEDSQPRRLPLGGFDDEALYDSPVEDAVDRSGLPMAVYKKKGQKRTTRRVNMKPVRAKRPPATAEPDESDDDLVPETQAGTSSGRAETEGSRADFEDGAARREKATCPSKADAKKEGALKRTVRKVNELAHANFHRLKLRNNGAKGGPGYNSKFRRRR